MCDRHFSFEGIDACDFSFDEVYASVQHGVAQVKRDVFWVTPAKRNLYQGRVKDKMTAARHQRDLMFVAQLFGKPLCGYNAAKPPPRIKTFAIVQPLSRNRSKCTTRTTFFLLGFRGRKVEGARYFAASLNFPQDRERFRPLRGLGPLFIELILGLAPQALFCRPLRGLLAAERPHVYSLQINWITRAPAERNVVRQHGAPYGAHNWGGL